MPQIPKPPDKAPRKWHEWYAKAFGYFWLPCPLCREMTGGHEWRDVDGKPSSIPDPDYPPGSGRAIGICPDCTRAGRGEGPAAIAVSYGTWTPDGGRQR